MSKAEIVRASIDNIQPNPFRMLGEYPFHAQKLDALQRSITDVGLWEGVIARKHGRGYQLAFGHHRVEAARLSGLVAIPVIVRDLSDEQMLQFMGRENMEDYNADFLMMLETWEAGVKFLQVPAGNLKPVDLARVLGWTKDQKDGSFMNNTAKACNAAHQLMSEGYISRKELVGITVDDADRILTRAQQRVTQVHALGTKNKLPAKQIEQAKRQIGKAVGQTAREVRRGEVTKSDIRGRVDVNAYRFAKDKKNTPLFAAFGRAIADNLERTLATDADAAKLEEIAKVVNQITLDEDRTVLRRIDYMLAELAVRSEGWRRKLAPRGANVVPLKLLKKEA